jgi:hypothetical protein
MRVFVCLLLVSCANSGIATPAAFGDPYTEALCTIYEACQPDIFDSFNACLVYWDDIGWGTSSCPGWDAEVAQACLDEMADTAETCTWPAEESACDAVCPQ